MAFFCAGENATKTASRQDVGDEARELLLNVRGGGPDVLLPRRSMMKPEGVDLRAKDILVEATLRMPMGSRDPCVEFPRQSLLKLVLHELPSP